MGMNSSGGIVLPLGLFRFQFLDLYLKKFIFYSLLKTSPCMAMAMVVTTLYSSLGVCDVTNNTVTNIQNG